MSQVSSRRRSCAGCATWSWASSTSTSRASSPRPQAGELLWDKAAQRAKHADFGAAAICAEGPAGTTCAAPRAPAFFAPGVCGDDSEMCADDSEMRADDSEMRADDSEMHGDDRTRARGYSGKVRPAHWWVVPGSASHKRACSHTSRMPVPVLTCWPSPTRPRRPTANPNPDPTL